mmetsp:Transcript_36599/g.90332  ORF Transcript_36599/g.90332 Transcript_36599/m.90332 type:complete len:278 (+) Transcript_36599:403-1236(+)
MYSTRSYSPLSGSLTPSSPAHPSSGCVAPPRNFTASSAKGPKEGRLASRNWRPLTRSHRSSAVAAPSSASSVGADMPVSSYCSRSRTALSGPMRLRSVSRTSSAPATLSIAVDTTSVDLLPISSTRLLNSLCGSRSSACAATSAGDSPPLHTTSHVPSSISRAGASVGFSCSSCTMRSAIASRPSSVPPAAALDRKPSAGITSSSARLQLSRATYVVPSTLVPVAPPAARVSGILVVAAAAAALLPRVLLQREPPPTRNTRELLLLIMAAVVEEEEV